MRRDARSRLNRKTQLCPAALLCHHALERCGGGRRVLSGGARSYGKAVPRLLVPALFLRSPTRKKRARRPGLDAGIFRPLPGKELREPGGPPTRTFPGVPARCAAKLSDG